MIDQFSRPYSTAVIEVKYYFYSDNELKARAVSRKSELFYSFDVKRIANLSLFSARS